MAAFLDLASFFLPVVGLLAAAALVVAGAFTVATVLISRVGDRSSSKPSFRR